MPRHTELGARAHGLEIAGERDGATAGWVLTASLGPLCALVGMAVGYELIDGRVLPRFALSPDGFTLGAAVTL
jgi:hypothetical protein